MIKHLLFITLLSTSAFAQQQDSTALFYSKIITKEELKKHLSIIASDEYEGRETGQKGQQMAAEYISNAFKSFGIKPYDGSSYYQDFTLKMIMPSFAEVTANGKRFMPEYDYFNFSGTSSQVVTGGDIIFLSYGIDEGDKYSDYKNIDVKNHIVMIMEGEPTNTDSTSFITATKTPSVWSTYYRAKIERAKQEKPSAILVVQNDINKSKEELKQKINSPALKMDLYSRDIPVLFISKRMANTLMGRETIDIMKQKIASKHTSFNFTTPCEVLIEFKNVIQDVKTQNVLGYVEGTDLKDELIVVTAHYDHLGKDGNTIYNGADDDGSGTVAVLELAHAFAQAKQNGKGPRRSMLFMTVTGEEKGLLGSAYYVEHPLYQLAKTVCDLNIDMIGRLDEKHKDNENYIYLIGSDKLSSELHSISENANKNYTNLQLDYTYNDENDKNRFYYRSDHYNFAKNGVPVIFYFNGVHADYHKETDEVDKINFNKMEKITKLVFFTAWQIANQTERIKVDSNKQ